MSFYNVLCPCTALVPVEAPQIPMRRKLRVCAYVRYFSEDEMKQENQMQDILDACTRRGITVAEQQQEIAKPYKLYRPALCRVLNAARQGRVDVLAVADLSRLSARPWKLRLILWFLNRHNVRLFTTEMELTYNLYYVGLDGKFRIRGYA